LAVELVRLVRDAEHRAEVIIREAQQKARQSVKETEAAAVAVVQGAEVEAERRAGDLIRCAQEEARLEAGPLVQKQRDEIASMQQKAELKLSEAVAMITERIVKFYAHS